MNKELDIFFNLDELATEHMINNKKMTVVVDEDKLEEGKIKNLDGINSKEILYYVKANDFGNLPKVDDEQKFDGKFMFVKNAIESDGIYEITLYQNRSE